MRCRRSGMLSLVTIRTSVVARLVSLRRWRARYVPGPGVGQEQGGQYVCKQSLERRTNPGS